ncbi:MAG: intradiol ring-cleavage dioxygenase [Woeseia sp.]
MTHDDAPVGRLLSRRDVSTLLGAVGGVLLTGIGVHPTRAFAETRDALCIVRPEQTEGPYFVDERLHRSDIRSDPADGQTRAGMPLVLTLRISRLSDGNCEPLADARVDLWHCDALGVYSDVQDPGFNTVGQKFLRGHQITDAAGEVRFVTVYPGWYPGRTVHIHFKIRTEPAARRGLEFTSQLYFDDALTDLVHAAAPYEAKGRRTRRNQDDGIFRRGGEQLVLAPLQKAEGYEASFAVGLQVA